MIKGYLGAEIELSDGQMVHISANQITIHLRTPSLTERMSLDEFVQKFPALGQELVTNGHIKFISEQEEHRLGLI